MKSTTTVITCFVSSPREPASLSATISSGEVEPSRPARVVIVEDDQAVQLSLRVILEGSGAFVCIGAYDRAETALGQLPDLKPDLVLMDINLPGMSGIDCLRHLKVALPTVRVVMASGLNDQSTVKAAAQAGCSDFVTKPFDIPQLLATLYVAMNRSTVQSATGHWAEHWNQLTDRERLLVRLIARGLKNKEIADQLGVSSNTLGWEIRGVFDKLRVRSRAETVVYLCRNEKAFEASA
jgi:DNA-binding NarL/FixJ family response regulator